MAQETSRRTRWYTIEDSGVMFFKLVVLFLFTRFADSRTEEDPGFTYNNGFQGADVNLNGSAQITPAGLLMLTDDTDQHNGHAFCSQPLLLVSASTGSALSFSTSFVFAIVSQVPKFSTDGMAFVIAPSGGLPGDGPSQYLGLFHGTNVIAVELDTIQNKEFNDINNNHIGININGLISNISKPASYNINGGVHNLSLNSGQPMQVWVEYDGAEKQLHVTLAPVKVPKPAIPLLSLSLDLSPFLSSKPMLVGFSASTGPLPTFHYVLGWSFEINGQAQQLIPSQLPKLPRRGGTKKSKFLTVGMPVIGVALVLLITIFGIQFMVKRKRKFAEVLEDWELEYGPHRFKYKHLYIATKGFSNKELLGSGGFGRVYRGVLPTSKIEVAIKRFSHESRQGMREFVAEIVSIGQLRHRNLVPLLGYCRRKGELLLVYDFMSNGSLDKFLFDRSKPPLNWSQRFRIIKGVASGLFYLHEEREQVVVHRDVKSSNILLDGEMKGRLGDFGLARLYEHGTDPHTTQLAGTIGYLAPEYTRTGKATTSSDVFAFGAFMLEVACGKRPIGPRGSGDELILVDWVFSCWKRGSILETVDPKLMGSYVAEEMELVLELALLCSQPTPTTRPSMRQLIQYLEGYAPVPELSLSLRLSAGGLTLEHAEGFDGITLALTSSTLEKTSAQSSSGAESLLSDFLLEADPLLVNQQELPAELTTQ